MRDPGSFRRRGYSTRRVRQSTNETTGRLNEKGKKKVRTRLNRARRTPRQARKWGTLNVLGGDNFIQNASHSPSPSRYPTGNADSPNRSTI